MADGHAVFREVHDRFYGHVLAYCRRRARADDVDDAVAEVFLTVWRKFNEVPPGDQALPWLYGVAYRVLTHQWRSNFRRHRLAEKLSSLSAPAIGIPDDVIVQRREARQLLTALAALNRTDQEILRLAAWEDLSHPEISVALGISVDAVRQRFYAAKKNLAAEYNRLENRRTVPAAEKGGAL